MIALHVTAGPAWAAWSFDPLAVFGVPLVGYLYFRGLRSLGPARPFHASLQPWAFYGGLLAVAAALLTPIDAFSDDLFWVHMTQHMLLMMIGAPLILLGAPIIPVMRGIPRPIRRALVIPFFRFLPVRLLLRTLSRPLVAWPVYVGTLWLWHIPDLFVAAIENEAIHTLEHVTFAAAAYLFWWNVIDPNPLRSNLSYLARIPYIFLTVVPAFVLGAFLTYSPDPWFAPYEITAPEYGLTAKEDQQLGGVIMWIPGSFIIGAALIIDLFMAVRQEQRQQLAEERGE